MENQKPTIGRIVIYNTTGDQQKAMVALACNNQLQLPATIVAVWSDTCVNLKVQVDGNHSDLWITSSTQGDKEGNWNWPVRN